MKAINADTLIDIIKDMTEDAVSVVRCKECKYDGTWKCKWRDVMTRSFPSADDFCSYGEREGE